VQKKLEMAIKKHKQEEGKLEKQIQKKQWDEERVEEDVIHVFEANYKKKKKKKILGPAVNIGVDIGATGPLSRVDSIERRGDRDRGGKE
jgi:hypothetical protein